MKGCWFVAASHGLPLWPKHRIQTHRVGKHEPQGPYRGGSPLRPARNEDVEQLQAKNLFHYV